MNLMIEPLTTPGLAADAGGGAAGGGGARQLPAFMEQQTETNWCWAACGASVGNFYHGPGKYTQCGIADACLGHDTCCEQPQPCNEYGYLDTALSKAGSYESMSSGSVDFAVLQAQIDTGRPVGTRVAWDGGGAHFMMVAGYQDDGAGKKITLQDPWYGTSTIVFASYAASYQVGGTWTHTYYTRKT